MAALRLRLRGPGKQHTANLPAEATFGDLVKEAATAFSLPVGEVEVLLGFPPAVCSADPGTALASLVKSGESLTVRRGTGGPVVQACSTEAWAPAEVAAPSPAPAAAPVAVPAAAPAATRPGVGSVRAGEPWECPACTLQNEGTAQICAACEGPRPGGPPASGGGAGAATSTGSAELVAMPDDNSCLFHGIAHVLDAGKQPGALRQIVAREVQANPAQWDEAVLGKPRQEYIDYIMSPIRWGGQVELAIFASAYRAEIGVVEVQSGRCDIYGEGSGYSRRVYLLHSGIHFDAVTFRGRREVGPEGFTQADADAKALAAERKRSGAYVDQDTMRLRCKICGYIANGDLEARAHAGGTGHKEFAPV